MPLLANKIYVLNRTKKDKKDDETVLSHPLTNEVCEDSEELARKTFIYNQNIWTCKITGQINLSFKEAQKSEQGCAKMLKNSFVKCYEPTVLQYVHHNRESLESIIHKAWTQIHEEFVVNEPVMIKLTTPKALLLKGIVVKIDKSPHKTDDDTEVVQTKATPDASNSDKENIKKKIIPLKKKYHYSVKLFEMDKLVNDIPSETIERTVKPPSKDQIRMFIRAHAVRYSGKNSNPWIVDEDLVKKYKLPNIEPEFVCDKAKIKEMSRAAEMVTYHKLMEDAQKKNGDVTVDLTLSDEEDSKRPPTNHENSGSKKMKQITLMDMHNASVARPSAKIKSPFSSPSRCMPPLAQQLLRLVKENKDDSMINQLVLKCCQYSDMQIAKFPDLIRVPIVEKKEKLELKRKLKNMTAEEREAFMAERRVELRRLQQEKRRVDGKVDDADMCLSGTIAEGTLLCIDPRLTQDQWARIASLSEFVRCFKGLLGDDSGDLVVDDFCRAVIGTKDCDKELFADLICLLLKPLLQDPHIKRRMELGVRLGELPVTACTATELLRLMLPWTDDDNEGEPERETEADGEHVAAMALNRSQRDKSASSALNIAIAGPICDRLTECEMEMLASEEKIAILELLQERILELEIIGSFIEEYQREATDAYKRRQMDMKEHNDRLKEIRTSMNDVTKLMMSADEAIALASVHEEGKTEEDVSSSVRRRLSLEMRNKEQEERDKRVELERQMQRLEKDEAACKRQIDTANLAYTAAINEAKQLMRVQPLGSDRFYRRYWIFRTTAMVIYVERELGDGECRTTEWREISTVEEVNQLIAGLDERGMRENALKKELQSILPRLREQMEALVKKACESANEAIVAEEVAATESFLVHGFKEELRETEMNIRQGSLGGVEDFSEWDQQLTQKTDLDDMKDALVAVFLGVHERFWNAPLKSANARSEFLASIADAKTQSRLNVLQCFLDVCVCWSKCASDDKCRVCHKSHKEEAMLLCDACNRAYHTFCLRPPLRKVPEGEWLCPDCRKEVKVVSTRSHKEEEEEVVAAEDGSEDGADEVEEEVCCVCASADTNMGKCVQCGLCYHADCHEPPLRNMRRAGWHCSSCRAEEGKAKVRGSRALANDSCEEEEDREREEARKKKAAVKRAVTVNGVHDKPSSARKKSRRGEESDPEASDVRKMTTRKRASTAIETPVNSGSKRARTANGESECEHISRCVKTLLKQLTNHKSSWPFLDAVDISEVPDYYDIVTRPMDLASVADRHKAGQYADKAGLRAFLADVAQIFTNADLYNEADSDVIALAVELESFFVSAYEKCDLGLAYTRKRK